MSDFMLNEVRDIYPQDDENSRQAHETDHSQGRPQAPPMQPPETPQPPREQNTPANQGLRQDFRMLEYTPSHPGTANLMQHPRPENSSSLTQRDINMAAHYASRQDRGPPHHQMYQGQRLNWPQGVAVGAPSGGSSYQRYPDSYYPGQGPGPGPGSHYRRSSTSVHRPLSATSASVPDPAVSSQRKPSSSSNSSSHTHSRQSSQSKAVLPPQPPHGHRPPSTSSQHSQGHISTREPDGRRWSSRVEAPQDHEVPVQYSYPPPPLPQYYYHQQRRQQQHPRGHESSFPPGRGGPGSGGPGPGQGQGQGPSISRGHGPSPSQSSSSGRDIEGLGIHTYSSSPRRSHAMAPERNSQRPSLHEPAYGNEVPPSGGWGDPMPPGYQLAGPPLYPPYMQHGHYPRPWSGPPSNYPSHPGPGASPGSVIGTPMGAMGGVMPDWYSVGLANPGPHARGGVKLPEGRPPGGWYWSVTTVHQHKRTESRSTQQRHKQEPGHNDNTVPVQLCEPPLSNIVPPNPAALAADPPPKNKKKSKYTSEQDKLILDLKHKGLGWSEIAKLAKCDKTLAARNRYQVLIGQQGGGTFLWSHPDIRKLQSYLDESERAKWHFLADELSRRRGRKFTLEMCHYKISEMFRDSPGQFGVLKSKDPRNGGIPIKRQEYEPHFSTLPPEDSPPHGYQPPGGAPPPPPPPGASGASAV